jgi:threonine dehydratase
MLTPHQEYAELAETLGFSGLYFKREDLHPYGSHKGRSIPVMIDEYYTLGDRRFALSSSGNAALAAGLYIKELNSKNKEKAELDIFVGTKVDAAKLARLKKLTDDHVRVLTKERPLQALTLATQEGVRSLRQSTDDLALKGYTALAEELLQIPDLGAVFLGTSSGTTAQALAQYFTSEKLPVQVHIVQTSSCHPISDAFETYEGPEEKSIADAITDITAQRKNKLARLIEESKGYGWFATNEEIRAAQTLTKKHADLAISTNSALAVVGAMQAGYRGYEIEGAVACLICGS